MIIQMRLVLHWGLIVPRVPSGLPDWPSSFSDLGAINCHSLVSRGSHVHHC